MSHDEHTRDPEREIPLATSASLLARMEAALLRDPSAVLATDADGTIWDGDVGYDLFEALLSSKGVREAAHEALIAEAEAFGVSAEGSPTDVATALCAAHLTEQYPHDRAFAMMAWAFAGWSEDELRAFADEVLDRGKIEARIRPAMREILTWADRRRVPIYVVSASPIAIVEVGTKRLGVTITRALAMTPAIGEDGTLLPRLAGPVVYGEGKVRALEQAGVLGTLLAAFGDSAYDAAMLRRAHVPVAVTPAPRLVELLPGIAGVSELSPLR